MTIPITPWKDEYATGNSLVDEQHQSIFSIVNALSRAMDEGHGEALIEDTIQGLKSIPASTSTPKSSTCWTRDILAMNCITKNMKP
jgi:hypothetical protein